MQKSSAAHKLEAHLFGSHKPRTEPTFTGHVLGFVSKAERDLRACALDAAMRETRTSNAALAAALGVSDTVIRGLRNGARPLRDDRVALFGPRLAAAYATALAGPLQLCLFTGAK